MQWNIEKDMNEKCFICDIAKYKFELRAKVGIYDLL